MIIRFRSRWSIRRWTQSRYFARDVLLVHADFPDFGSGFRGAVAVGSDLGSDLSFTKPASILAGSEVAVQGAGIYRKIYILIKIY